MEPLSRQTRLRLAVLVLAGLVLAACSSNGSSGGTTRSASTAGEQITVKSLMFMPSTLTIKAGTTVTWRNDEPITHTVTSGAVTGVDKTTGLRSGAKPDGRFDAKLKTKGATFSYTFTKPGTYSYYCDIHYGMNAEIVVTP